MKVLKKTISLAIALIMIISLIPTNIVNAAVGDSESNPIPYSSSDRTNFPQSPNQGYVLPVKTANWVENEDNVAKVTMSLQGKGVQKKTDVVLVIDRSGSMSSKIRIYNYKEVPVTFTASDVNCQYNNNKNGGTWTNYTSKTATISMTAYVDNNGVFKGYKDGTMMVSGLDVPNAKRYKISSTSGFSNWTNLDDDDCANALILIFAGSKCKVSLNNNDVDVVFPSTNSALMNTTNGFVYSSETKISAAKVAAKRFVSELLATADMRTLNRISIVSYSSSGYGNGEVYVDSNLSNNNTSLNTAIDGINANGGTNIQAGIKKAQELLSSSQADNKYIVVLSDGEPTFSYEATGSTVTQPSDIALNYPNDIGYVLTNFNSYVLGTGSDFEYYSYWEGGYSYYINGNYVTNNGIPTISQALLAKRSGIGLYSVGFDVINNDNAIYTMKHVASSVDNFYLATDDLSTVFSNIAGKILKAGTNAKVNNVMGEDTVLGYNFTVLKDGSHPVTVTQGAATVTQDLRSINWDLGTSGTGGDITETPAVLTYYIKLNVTGGKTINPSAILNTGNTTSVLYKNYLGLWCRQDFPSSALTAGSGMLNVSYYLSDKNGNPVNSNGAIIPFKDRVMVIEPLNQAVTLNTTIKVSDYAREITGYLNQSKTAKNENGIDVVPSIIATRATVYLNFPYALQPTFSVLYNGNSNTGGNAPIDSVKHKEADPVNVLDKGTLEKTGYSFRGWSTTSSGTVEYAVGSVLAMPPKDVTLFAVWERSQFNLRINYIYEGGATFNTYSVVVNVNDPYSVNSPIVNGWTTNRLVVSGTMPNNDVTVDVYYTKNKNRLYNNTMYKTKGAEPIGSVSSSISIVEKFDYTFGFKFKAGKDLPTVTMQKSGDTGNYSLINFKLYEGGTLRKSASTLDALMLGTSIETGKTYTITYNLNANSKDKSLTLKIIIDAEADMEYEAGVTNTISIISKEMPVLE